MLKQRKLLILRKLIELLFVIIALYFLLNHIIKHWGNTYSIIIKIEWVLFIISVLILFISIINTSFLWYRILKSKEKINFPLSKVIYIQLISSLGKYIPGKITTLLGKIYLVSNENVDKKNLTFSTLFEQVFILLSGSIISLPFIFFYSFEGHYIFYALIFILLSCISLHPKSLFLLTWVLSKFFKRFDEINSPTALNPLFSIKSTFLYLSNAILSGLGFCVLIYSIVPYSWEMILPFIGLISFAGIISLLVLIAPAGIGVREGIIIVALSQDFGVETATLIGVLQRLWTIFADAFVLIYVIIYKIFFR